MQELKGEGYAAAVFTQLTDVEGELNGYFSYDRSPCSPCYPGAPCLAHLTSLLPTREVAKVDLATLAELHRALRED